MDIEGVIRRGDRLMPDTRMDAGINHSIGVAPKPRLFDEARRRLRLKHYSLRTEQALLDPPVYPYIESGRGRRTQPIGSVTSSDRPLRVAGRHCKSRETDHCHRRTDRRCPVR